MKRPDRGDELSGLELLEEATHVLRTAPPAHFLVYYAGSLPFTLALLTFWADMSHTPAAFGRLAEASLLLAVLFVLMKLSHALFCRRLGALLRGGSLVPASFSRVTSIARSQAAFQPLGLFVLPIALLLTLPFGWAFAFFQNVTVLGGGDRRPSETAKDAWRLASLWPRQNHMLLAILFLFGLFAFLDFAVLLLLVPHLFKMLFGVETVFTRSGVHVLNTTFLFSAMALTYLAVDPFVKAAYTLRCFHGESTTSGEDLLALLRKIREKSAPRGVTASLLAAVLLAGSSRAGAQEPRKVERPSQPVSSGELNRVSAELNRALDDVLKRSEFRWRMPRERQPEAGGVVGDFLGAVAGTLRRAVHAIVRAVRAFSEWLSRMARSGGPRSDGSAGAASANFILFVLVAVVLAAAVTLVRRGFVRQAPDMTILAAGPAEPDLLGESVPPDLHPPEEWLDLARSWLAKGDLRRALRALYIAGLGELGRQELIHLAAHKSNGEYVRELKRRVPARTELLSGFQDIVAEFETIWYGRAEIQLDGIDRFRARLERLRVNAEG